MTPSVSRLTVLVVDDNPADRVLVRALLSDDAGGRMRVLEAADVEEAAHVARQESPDAILLDLNLGPTTGLESLRRLYAEVPSIPILVHSGLNDEDTALESLSVGAVDYLIKGKESGRSFRRTIHMALERLRLTDEVTRQRIMAMAREEQLRRTDALIGEGLVAVDPWMIVVRANRAASSILGMDDDEIRGTPLTRWLPELERLDTDGVGSALVGSPILSQIDRGDGRGVPVELLVSPTPSVQGEAYLVRIRDRSGEVSAEMAVRRLEHEYEALLQSAGQGILGLDEDARITFANSAAIALLSVEGEQVVGRRCEEFCGATKPCPVAEAARSGENYRGEQDMVRRDGSTFPARLILRPFSPEAGEPGAVLVLEDLTEQHRLQEQLRQAQKMELIGQLAGGIAHDFNNELAVIGLNASMLELDAGEGRPADPELLEEIRAASERATGITRQLLGMSRRAELDVGPADLGTATRRIEKLARKLLPESIDVSVRVDEGTHVARVDENALDQALLNLCSNAGDAMPEGGTLTLALDEVRIPPNYELRGPIGDPPAPGSYMRITVADTGHGMSKSIIERVMEPFFTTKPKGRGTGLGLPMVYGTVRQLEGFIEIESEVGMGSTFRIHLPAASQEVERGSGREQPSWEGDGTGFVVLVVEDEAPLRAACRSVLERYGFTVIEAENGVEALERFESTIDGIDIVLSDNVMPEMSGAQLYGRLLAEWGPVPFVLTTGYSKDLPSELEDVPVLHKPWKVHDLLETVWRELHRLDSTTLTGS